MSSRCAHLIWFKDEAAGEPDVRSMLTAKELDLTPADLPEQAKASETIKRLLSNLASITQGVAELRNDYGIGHGKAAGAKGRQPRHAKLAVGAASMLAVFLAETHNERAP